MLYFVARENATGEACRVSAAYWYPCCRLWGLRYSTIVLCCSSHPPVHPDKQSIGVAVCDRPEGPFEPKGDRPLISTVRPPYLQRIRQDCVYLWCHLIPGLVHAA